MTDNPYAPPLDIRPPALPVDKISRSLEGVQYPLSLSFKVFAFRQQITLTDANGRVILYTKRKFFKIKEHIEIFTDKTQTVMLAEIRANKIIDWSARYNFTDGDGGAIGSVGRKGWRSIFKCHYQSFNPGDEIPDYDIHEENPMAKVFDALLGEIPLLGILTAFLFHPRYLASKGNQGALRLTKKAAFFEGKFELTKLAELTPREELNLILSFLMLCMLERRRG